MSASRRVVRAIEAGWTPACDGRAAVSGGHISRTPGAPPYWLLDVIAGRRQIQVSISPAGRSVRVFVDGKEV